MNPSITEPFYFSYSSLNLLLHSPVLFYNSYILGNRPDKDTEGAIEGRVIHCLLLSEDIFHQQFIVSDLQKLPKAEVRKFIKGVYKRHKEKNGNGSFSDCSIEILEELQEINLHQKLKTDDQRIEKVLTTENSEYFEFLKLEGTKKVIDLETYNKCLEIRDILINNKNILKALNIDKNPKIKTYNELPLRTFTENNFGIQGVLDNVNVDFDNNIITINDLKTTSKTLGEFKESVEYYKYWLQAAIYTYLVNANKDFFKINSTWELKFNFIVIDKYRQIYQFAVSDDTMRKWIHDMYNVFEVASYHYNENDYTLPFEFIKGNVKL